MKTRQFVVGVPSDGRGAANTLGHRAGGDEQRGADADVALVHRPVLHVQRHHSGAGVHHQLCHRHAADTAPQRDGQGHPRLRRRRFRRADAGRRRDCSEISELAASFNAMADSLQETERQRRDFIANVSHELKTPMTTIAGYTDGILDGTIPPEKRAAVPADHLRREPPPRAVWCAGCSTSPRSRTRSHEEGGVRPVRSTPAWPCCPWRRRSTDRGLDVDADIPEDSVMVQGDQDLITQVIYNLLENAAKFATPGSTAVPGSDGHRGEKAVCHRPQRGRAPSRRRRYPLLFERFHKIGQVPQRGQGRLRTGAVHRQDHSGAAQGADHRDQRKRLHRLYIHHADGALSAARGTTMQDESMRRTDAGTGTSRRRPRCSRPQSRRRWSAGMCAPTGPREVRGLRCAAASHACGRQTARPHPEAAKAATAGGACGYSSSCLAVLVGTVLAVAVVTALRSGEPSDGGYDGGEDASSIVDIFGGTTDHHPPDRTATRPSGIYCVDARRRRSSTVQEVYAKVNPAAVTGGGRDGRDKGPSVGTGVIMTAGRLYRHQRPRDRRRHRLRLVALAMRRDSYEAEAGGLRRGRGSGGAEGRGRGRTCPPPSSATATCAGWATRSMPSATRWAWSCGAR